MAQQQYNPAYYTPVGQGTQSCMLLSRDRLIVDPTNPTYATQPTTTTGYPAPSTYPQTPTQTAPANTYPNGYSQTGVPVYNPPTTNGYVANTTTYVPQSRDSNGVTGGYSAQGTALAYTGSYQAQANPPTYSQSSTTGYPNVYQQQQQATPSYTSATPQSGMNSYPTGTGYPAPNQQTYNTMSPSTYTQQPTQGATYYYQ